MPRGPGEFHNPLEHVIVTARGRVDEGVDYTVGGGYISAIADGIVTYSSYTPSGWPGAYIAYRITQPGDLEGAIIYQAEGVTNLWPVGEHLVGGDLVCSMQSGASIEIGFGSDNPPNSWARQYGSGYDQANSTGAGLAFNDLLGLLGAPQGIVQGHELGARPPYSIGRGAVLTSGSLTLGQLLTAYNPSTIIRHDFYVLGEHGRRAYANANQIRRLLSDTRYCTMRGAN